MAESNWQWLLRKQFEERGTNIRMVWDFYIKFYIAFLALNIAGIGAVVQYVAQRNRTPIIIAFSMHNLLAVGTAVFIYKFTQRLNSDMRTLAEAIREDEGVGKASAEIIFKAPLPLAFARYTSIANSITHIGLIGCWVSLRYIAEVSAKSGC
ncbi:MAG: hypothetical protein QOF89_4181 [Acidobacteriota bacterium]|jgi:hypothetical protein|nr:hypothetical protein [Acidobacteriota bacterium]